LLALSNRFSSLQEARFDTVEMSHLVACQLILPLRVSLTDWGGRSREMFARREQFVHPPFMFSACDYREFRPHPCGTLIADLVDELATVATIGVSGFSSLLAANITMSAPRPE
jgi:hypothetical protein